MKAVLAVPSLVDSEEPEPEPGSEAQQEPGLEEETVLEQLEQEQLL